jgi:hypothetical protein
MKIPSSVSNFLTNKWVLKFIAIIAFFNVIGYMLIGKLNNVIYFIVLAILISFFTKNYIIVLGIPLICINFLSINTSHKEGMENTDENTSETDETHNKTINKVNDENRKKENYHLQGTENPENAENEISTDNETVDNEGVVSSNIKTDEQFEVGRHKNKNSRIDYAATIEDAYDDLNKILGSDGIKRLTDDTQHLMKQQMELAKSMEAMTPLIQGIMPMAKQAQSMMQSMDTGGGGLGNIMDIAKKMSSSLKGSPVTNTN